MGPSAAWAGEKPRKDADFREGCRYTTIMLVEIANSDIAWMEPRDLSLDALAATEHTSPTLEWSRHRYAHWRHENFLFTWDKCYDAGERIHVAVFNGHGSWLRLAERSSDQLRKSLEIDGCPREGQQEVIEPKPPCRVIRRPNWPNIAALLVWLLSVGAAAGWRGKGQESTRARFIGRLNLPASDGSDRRSRWPRRGAWSTAATLETYATICGQSRHTPLLRMREVEIPPHDCPKYRGGSILLTSGHKRGVRCNTVGRVNKGMSTRSFSC